MLKILSWNVLAPDLTTSQTADPWDARLPLILDLLRTSPQQPDIMLLQEVPLARVAEDFVPLYLTYDVVPHTCHKKRSQGRTNPIGNVTFLKKGLFVIDKVVEKTRALHILVDPTAPDQCPYWISNIHFSAGRRSKQEQRCKEWVSCCNVWGPASQVLVAGDFNEGPTDGLAPLWQAEGFQYIAFPDRSGASLVSTPEPTCYLASEDAWKVNDLILFRGGTAQPMFLLPLTLLPIPNPTWPSDHRFLLAEWTPPRADRCKRCWKASLLITGVVYIVSLAWQVWSAS